MKGVVFVEFMDMVETRMGLDILDHIITEAVLPDDGAYTSVGTYDHAELVRLLGALGKATGMAVPALLLMFGEHLFQRFHAGYPSLFAEGDTSFAFLSRIDSVIHVEVRKLYPDAELPTLHCWYPAERELVMVYGSPRGLGDLAEGLIRGYIAHFGEPISVARSELEKEGSLHRVRFHLTLAPA